MITPTDRLLFWVAALVPFAALAALAPAAGLLAVGLFAAAAGIAACDAAAARANCRLIEVRTPPVVRLSKDQPGAIPLEISVAGAAAGQPGGPAEPPAGALALVLAVAPALPADIRSAQEELRVLASADWARSAVAWPCTARRRGTFALERCYFRLASPLGLWHARRMTVNATEIRVYPDLQSERRRLAAVFLKRGRPGVHAQRLVGQGREFEQLRDYIPGDSFDDVHWKATAKRGRPVTKLYQVERTQEIYVAVDASRLSARAAGGVPEIERFLQSALVLGAAAQQHGDLFGVIAFSDRVLRFIRAGAGKAHYAVCRDALFDLNSARVSPDFEEFAAFVRLRLRRRALLMLLTDLGDPVLAESFQQAIGLICRQHLILVSMPRSAEVRPLFAQPDAQATDDLYRDLAGHLIWRRVRQLEQALRRLGVGFALVESDKLSAQLVTQYMRAKARQVL